MNFFPKTTGAGALGRVQQGLRRWSVAALVLLAACGGGSSQYEAFVPGRVLVVGDDLSALTSDGRKYAVNGLNTDSSLSCGSEALWVQSVAAYYGMVFRECNPNGATAFKAIMRAAAGAKVADIAAQVDTQLADGGFQANDLVLALGGMNDVLELYARSPAEPDATLIAEARVRGEAMAAVVNRLVDLQAKVVVSMLPDVGLSPFALAEEAIKPGSAALMSALTSAFNERLGVKVLLDGRYVGLMQSDLRIQQITKFASSFGFSNVTDAACTLPLPNCTTATLVTGATAGTYLWADGTRLSSGGQAQLGTMALERSTRNPF